MCHPSPTGNRLSSGTIRVFQFDPLVRYVVATVGAVLALAVCVNLPSSILNAFQDTQQSATNTTQGNQGTATPAVAQSTTTQDEKTAQGSTKLTDTSSKTDEPKKPAGVLDMSFDDIKFDIEVGEAFKREMLGEKIENLNGQTIRIKGFIRPSFRQDGITKFVFVRDNQECCFGPGAAIYDCILVELAPEKTTEFTVRAITVKGEFFLREYQGPDGNIWAIFRMKNGVVE